MSLKTHRLPSLVSGSPDSVAIFLHGLGDSGAGGLLEICKVWQAVLPHTEFLCPDAPFPFDMAPADFGGRQWFSLRDFSKPTVERGVETAAPILNSYIDEILSTYHLKPSRLVLVGFSQGTMMALYVALRRKETLGGVLGYSGLLSHPEKLAEDVMSKPPILLIHGTLDDVVPFHALNAAECALKAQGLDIQTERCLRLGHSIDNDGIKAGAEFLKKVLKN